MANAGIATTAVRQITWMSFHKITFQIRRSFVFRSSVNAMNVAYYPVVTRWENRRFILRAEKVVRDLRVVRSVRWFASPISIGDNHQSTHRDRMGNGKRD